MLLTLFIITMYICYMQGVKADIHPMEHLCILLMFVLLLSAIHHYDSQLRKLQHHIDTVVWRDNCRTHSLVKFLGGVVEFISKDYKSSNLRYSINRLRRKIKYFLS